MSTPCVVCGAREGEAHYMTCPGPNVGCTWPGCRDTSLHMHLGDRALAEASEMQETVLEEAQRIIYGDREQTYGHPAKNFENIAAFWNAYIKMKRGVDANIDPDDVALMMALMKIARQTHKAVRDNITDICGYAACVQKIADYANPIPASQVPAP